MKRHLTASAVGIGRQNASAATERAANRALTAFHEKTPKQPTPSEPSTVLASVSARTHTLILTGELDHRSAPALEAEIEQLCKEGVTGITLDLRELTYIDSTGVAVIAFRYRLCKRRGYELAVIPGSRFIHRALEQAGVEDLLPFQREDVA